LSQLTVPSYADGKPMLDLADGVTIGGDAITKIYTGTYTGDGGVAHAITGVGFSPKMVIIYPKPFASQAWLKMDTFNATAAQRIEASTYDTDKIISLDADGFTVDDDGADADPNTNGREYCYICLG